ncbi:MAG: hypothetical protein WAL22_12795 [Solirubrobacteraceae bacterium]
MSDEDEQTKDGGEPGALPLIPKPADARRSVVRAGGSGPASPGSRVSVVDEAPPRPAPPDGASDDEYQWHSYKIYPSGRPDAVEFVDTYKAFGR